MNEEKRNALEAELRCLHSDMYYAQESGDWKMARSMERTIKALKDCKTVEEMAQHFGALYEDLKESIQAREIKRARIEELEKELEEL